MKGIREFPGWRPSDEEVETVRGLCESARVAGDREEFWLTLTAICDEVRTRRRNACKPPIASMLADRLSTPSDDTRDGDGVWRGGKWNPDHPHNVPKPRTAEEVLALPEYSFSARKIVCRCGCTITIPYMAELRASYVAADDIIAAVDGDGVSWTPVDTEFGWRRRIVGR